VQREIPQLQIIHKECERRNIYGTESFDYFYLKERAKQARGVRKMNIVQAFHVCVRLPVRNLKLLPHF